MKTASVNFFTFAFALFILGGCAHSIHEVHTSDFIPGGAITTGKVVKAATEQFVILGFTGNTDYVDEAYQKLMRSCPTGTISGITTQYSTSLGFFSWKNKILMQGLCSTRAELNATRFEKS